MHIITRYFTYSARKQAVQICLTIVLPMLIPYIFAGILEIFTKKPGPVNTEQFNLPYLPEPVEIHDVEENFYYFGTSSVEGDAVIRHLKEENGLGTNARIMQFQSEEDAKEHFARANIGEQLRNVDTDKAKTLFLLDLKDNFNYSGQASNLFIDHLEETYKGIYNLKDSDFEEDESLPAIFLYIDILENGETINGVPRNITVQIVYNTTMLDNLLKRELDPISERYGNLEMEPFWTGYALTLEKHIDEYIVKRYSDIVYNVEFEELNAIPSNGMQITNIMFFEMSVLFAWAIEMIFATLLASYNRADKHVVLRRLGVTEGQFWLANTIYLLIVLFTTVFLQVIVWHFTGVLPFSGMSFDFCLFEAVLLTLQFTLIASFFSVLLGMSKTAPILSSCVLSFIFLFLPSMFHAGFFNSTTLFDPSLVPEWGTWLSMAICPLFGVFGLMDSMTSGLNETLTLAEFMDYKWHISSDLTPITYLFTDYQHYTTKAHICAVTDSRNGFKSPLTGECMYYEPLYGYVILLNLIEVMLMTVLLPLIGYWKREKANRGLPFLFPFKRKFWNREGIRPGENGNPAITMRNICVIFSKEEKKSAQKRSEYQKLFFRKNFVLQGMNLSLEKREICSLVGESNEGKSTILNVLAGEVSPTNMKKFVSMHQYKERGTNHGETFQEVSRADDRHQMLTWLQNLKSPICQLFGNIDILDPYNAYFIKPYIGYCPEDFSNVWMQMSVYNNVWFSLKMRLHSTHEHMDNIEDYLEDILKKAGLGDSSVQRRSAKQLSGGMLRRLAFCNALVGSHHILLLDEISAGVDPVIKRQIWEILRFVKGTVLLTSHDMGEIGEMTQNITVINDGHSLVDNVNEFELRGRYNEFNVNLYKGKSMVDYSNFEKLEELIPHVLELEIAQQHILEVKIAEALTTDELVDVCSLLDIYVEKYSFDDYNVDKCSLSDIYVNLIGSKKETAEVTGEAIKTPKPSKFIALFRKSCYVDFRFTTVPLIFVLTLVALVLCVCTYLFYFLFSSVFDMSVKALSYQTRWGDLGKPCFEGCINYNRMSPENTDLDRINQCFMTREPPMLFAYEPFAEYESECKYYLSYLGLDEDSNFRTFLGDASNVMPDTQKSYAFAVVEPHSEDGLDYFETPLVEPPDGYVFPNVEVQYEELYAAEGKYNPLLEYENDGITPYLGMTRHALPTPECAQLRYCTKLCQTRNVEYFECGEFNFSLLDCLADCNLAYVCKQEEYAMAFAKGAYAYSTLKEALEAYESIKLLNEMEVPYNLTDYNAIRVQQDGPNQYNIHSILRIAENGGNVSVKASIPLPNVGRTIFYYGENQGQIEMNSTQKYECKGEFSESPEYLSIFNAKMKTPHSDAMAYSMTYQEMPDRSHVRLFDIQNEPLTQVSAAVIRKHLFRKALNYEPWNFSYAISTFEMPVFASPDIEEASVLSANDLLKSICALHFAVVAMFPMMHAAIQVGNEIEMLALNLYELHGISPSEFVLSQLIYEVAISCVPVVVDLIAAMILCPFLIFDSPEQVYNVLWFVLQSFLGMPTGMLMGILYKRGKPAAMTTFFIILVVLVFQMFEFSSKVFTIIVAIFIPSYILIYEQALINSNEPVDWPFVGYCILFTLLHILFCLFLVNYQLISKRLKSKIHGKQLYVEEAEPLLEEPTDSSEDQGTILEINNVSHTYDGKLYALKNVSFEIPKNHVFGLLGANGSGKSTLMHCLAGIYRPTSGSAICGGINLFERQTTTDMFSIVPQQDILFENLTVLDHLSLFDEISGGRGIKLNKIVEIMALTPFLYQPVFSLSGGVKRKLSFALTLCANPEIIALDEPSTGLGATTKKAVEEAVFALIETGKTVVLTSHDMEEVEMICDQCVILKDGELVAKGRVRELRKAADTDFELQIQLTEEDIEKLNSYLLQAGIEYTYGYNEICEFSSYQFEKGVTREDIIVALKEARLDHLPWIIEAMKLEKVFLQIVGRAGIEEQTE